MRMTPLVKQGGANGSVCGCNAPQRPRDKALKLRGADLYLGKA